MDNALAAAKTVSASSDSMTCELLAVTVLFANAPFSQYPFRKIPAKLRVAYLEVSVVAGWVGFSVCISLIPDASIRATMGLTVTVVL